MTAWVLFFPAGKVEKLLKQMEGRIMSAFDDLKTEVRGYIADVDKAFEDIAKKIDDAIAADDAGEDVDLAELKDEVAAARARVGTPPVTPEPEPAATAKSKAKADKNFDFGDNA